MLNMNFTQKDENSSLSEVLLHMQQETDNTKLCKAY